jgi:hypothetical protein
MRLSETRCIDEVGKKLLPRRATLPAKRLFDAPDRIERSQLAGDELKCSFIELCSADRAGCHVVIFRAHPAPVATHSASRAGA